MALQYLFDPNKQFQSLGGVNEVSGFLRVFLNGTDDRATTYKNFDGTLNEADIVLDSYGRAVVIVDDTKTYRIEVYNRLGGLMWTVSNYKARVGSGGGSGTPVSVEGTVGEIDVDENTEGGVKHFVVGLAATIKNAIATLTMAVNGVANALNGKKDKQTPVNESGSTTKTLVGISQDANGEMSATFDDIEFPDYSQRFDNIENEQIVDAKVIAAALNDLNVRMESVEDAQDEKNIGERIADAFDSQNLFERGVRVKVRQAAKSLDGATNKTVTNVSQDENGEITVTFSSISLSDYEKTANKKKTFSGFETSDTFYPTLKAVVDYLDGRLQNLGGKKITNNGQPFTNYSQLPSSTPYYGQNINTDDYAYVQDTGLASRYTATVTGSSVLWTLDYEIALPVFTAEQQDAIDSGVNSTKVGNYDNHLSDTGNPHNVTAAQVGAVRYDTASQGLTSTQKQNARTNIGAGTYSVPGGGIPKTDLASGVQSSLDKADSALQNHQSVVNSAPTLSWGNTSTVGSVGATALTVKMPSNPATGKLDTNGDGSDVTASFTTAGSRNNISTGEKLSVIFGKIAKWFGDLKAVAFSGNYSDLSGTPTIPTAYTSSPNMDGSASAGSSGSWSRGDHTHPHDTSKQDSLPYSSGKYGISISGSSDSVSKTSLGQVNTLPVASMVSSDFKAGTFFLKATADGGSAYSFGDITIPNNQWYRFTVNGESSNYCVITLEPSTGGASSPFNIFKILVDNGSNREDKVMKVVRVPYGTTTSEIGNSETPVYVDASGEIKPCSTSKYYMRWNDTTPQWITIGADAAVRLWYAENYRVNYANIELNNSHPMLCYIVCTLPALTSNEIYDLSIEITITGNGSSIQGGMAIFLIDSENSGFTILSEYAPDGMGGFLNIPQNRMILPANGNSVKYKVYVSGHAYRVARLA